MSSTPLSDSSQADFSQADSSLADSSLADSSSADSSLADSSSVGSSQAELILQAMVAGMPDIFFAKDSQGKYVLMNQAAASWLNITIEEAIGRTDQDLFPVETAQKIQIEDRRVLQSANPAMYEEEIVQGGQVRSLNTLKMAWRDSHGVPQGVIGLCRDVTEQKRTSQALHRSEQGLRQVIDSLDHYVGVVSPDGTLREVNRKVLEISNLRAEDVVGLSFEDTYWWNYSAEVKTRLRSAMQRAFQGETVRYDEQIRIAPNQFISIDFSVVPVINEAGQVEYLVPSGVDITERLQTADALRQSEVINQAILSALPDLIVRMDAEGTYLDVKAGNFPLSSLSEAKIGENVRNVLPAAAAEKRLAMMAKALSTRTMQCTEFTTEIDGQPCWREIRMIPLSDREVIMSVRDFTKLHRARAALAEALHKEQAIRKEAERASRVKDEFLTVISHELRTPLNPILGWASLLRRGQLSEDKIAKAAETIERNAKLQTQLIDDLLDIARMLRGNVKLEAKPVSLKRTITQALETVQLAAQSKYLTIETQLAEGVQVRGDALRLQQIVWNLLSNAVKFTPEKGQVCVRLFTEGNQACIEISDTGVGIPPAFLPHVFERFRQENSTLTRQFGGLGLGLAIVRQLSELHGGTVRVTSAGENKGTTFSVRLPMTDSTSMVDSEPAKSRFLESLIDVHILVVDDNPDSRDILTTILQEKQATVVSVASGVECLRRLDHEVFDLLICDIGLPEIDGYQLMKYIRQRKANKGGQIKAIALTAYAGETYEQQAIDAGFQTYLTKPIEMASLMNTLQRVLYDS
jgi:PAS domain S-box-containing protein